MNTIGERLRLERKRVGLTQLELSAIGNVAVKSQNLYENDKRIPNADYLNSVNTVVDAVYILTGEKKEKPEFSPESIECVLNDYGDYVKNSMLESSIKERELRSVRIMNVISDLGGISFVAERMDVDEATIQRMIDKPNATGLEFFIKFSETFNVSLDKMLRGISQGVIEDFECIPEYNVRVAAGHGAWNDEENIIGHQSFERAWLTKRDLLGKPLAVTTVVGDSQKDLLWDGDKILINLEPIEFIASTLLYVVRINDELVIKFVQRLPSGKLLLSSKNKDYPPFEVDPEHDDVQIVGKLASSSRDWTLYN